MSKPEYDTVRMIIMLGGPSTAKDVQGEILWAEDRPIDSLDEEEIIGYMECGWCVQLQALGKNVNPLPGPSGSIAAAGITPQQHIERQTNLMLVPVH